MSSRGAKIRLFVEPPLRQPGQTVMLEGAPSHYLLDVMRIGVGEEVRVFNGVDGEWLATLIAGNRKTCQLRLGRRSAPQRPEPGPSLAFAVLKRNALDLVVQKATELGAERLLPIFTRHSLPEAPNLARLCAIATEAAEQSGRLTVPEIAAPVPVTALARSWPADRPLLLMTPDGRGLPMARIPQSPSPAGLLIGPEGGFAAAELDELLALPLVVPVSLGPLTLRAETAAIAALACWQSLRGEWSRPGPAAGVP